MAGRGSARIVAALAAFFWGFVFFGVIDLLSFAAGEEFHATLVLGTVRLGGVVCLGPMPAWCCRAACDSSGDRPLCVPSE